MDEQVSGRLPAAPGHSDEPASSLAADAGSVPSAVALLDLAARCDAAKGPDRELDAAIAAAVGAKHGRDSGWCNNHNGDYWVVDECAEAFTKSLDAALSLPPEGWSVRFEGCVFIRLNTGSWGQAAPGGVADRATPALKFSRATSPALALCAAALRARATQAIEARQEQGK